MTKLSKRSGSMIAMGLGAAIAMGLAGSARAAETAAAAPAPTMKKATAGADVNNLNGAIINRGGEGFTMRLLDRSEYNVVLTDETSIKTKAKGVFRGRQPYDVTSLIRGLILEVDGVGDEQGRVVAKKIRFAEDDLHSAITAQIHSKPIEESATAAHERISSLDEWKELGLVSVHFALSSSEISADGKKALDELAAKAPGASNYQVEITGHTDSTGSSAVNDELSAKRAENVVKYLTVTKNVPLRRIVLPMGYSATQGTADNSTEEGRAKNRRVDVRVLVNEGLAQTAATPGN